MASLHDVSHLFNWRFSQLARVLLSSTLLQYTPFSGKTWTHGMLYLAHDDFFSSLFILGHLAGRATALWGVQRCLCFHFRIFLYRRQRDLQLDDATGSKGR
jgi:hypothetical protein